MGLLSNLINRISGNTNTAATNTANKTAASASNGSSTGGRATNTSTVKTNTSTNTNSNKTLWQRISDWASTYDTNVDAAGYSYGAEGPSYVSPQVMNQTPRTTPKTIFPTTPNTGSQGTAGTPDTPSTPNYNAPNNYVWSDGRVHSYAEPTGAGTIDNTPSTPAVQGYTPGTTAPVNAATIASPKSASNAATIASPKSASNAINNVNDVLSDKILSDYNSSAGTNGLVNSVTEGEFNRSTAMQEIYGNYQNYKNGITVAQQQQQKANILGRGLNKSNDISGAGVGAGLTPPATVWSTMTSNVPNDYSFAGSTNGQKANTGTQAGTSVTEKLMDWLKTDPATRLAEQNAQKLSEAYTTVPLGSDLSNLTPAQQWYIEKGKTAVNTDPSGFSYYSIPNNTIDKAYANRKNKEDTATRKYNNVNPKTGVKEKGTKNPSKLYAVSTDPKYGIWTDQFGNRWTSDGKEVLSNQEFNRSNMTEYDNGTRLPVVDEAGNVVGSTYVDPITEQPINSSVAYNNYLGYLQDKSQVNSLGGNSMADTLANDGILPNSITNMYNTYNDYASAIQALADSGELKVIPEDALPNADAGGAPSGGGGGYYPSGGDGTVPTGTADTLYSLPEVGNYASQLMLNKMMPTGYDYDYNKRLDSRIGDLQAAQNAYVQSSIPLIARTYQDQAANSFANLLNTLRANRASGLTSGASRGAQAAQDVQAVQSANKENASSLNNLVNTNLAAYLQTLAGKRATAGSDTAGELQSYYSPMATALGEILAQYNYGSAAAQVNNGGLQRAQSYLV